MQATDMKTAIFSILLIALALTIPDNITAQTGSAERSKAQADDLVDSRSFNYYTNGLLAEGIGDHYGAAKAFREAWKFFPESYEIGYALASSYLRLQEAELALEITGKIMPVTTDVLRIQAACFRRLNRPDSYRNTYIEMTFIDPDDPDAYAVLGRLYLSMKDLDSARWAIEHETEIRSNDPELWNQLGRIMIGLNDPQAALEVFDKSLAINNSVDNIGAWLGKVDAYEVNSESAKAIEALKAAVLLMPDSPLILNRLVAGLTSVENFAEAAVYLKELTALVPEDLGQRRRLGIIYYYADSLDQAEAVFDGLIAADDIHDLNHHFLALIAMKRNDPETVLAEFIKAADINGKTSDAWMNIAISQRNLGHVNLAIEAYQTGLPQVSALTDSIRLLYTLGATYEELDSISLAIESFEKILEFDQDYHQAMNYLGYLLADRNMRLDYALELLTRAVSMDPENTAYLDSFGWVHFKLGNYSEAVTYLRKAAELDSDPIMFDHLGDALRASGESVKAQLWWQRALDLDPDNDTIKEKLKH